MSGDIFQFHNGSADAPPGKGNGETLASSPDTFSELRKVAGWRRVLASYKAGEPIDAAVSAILPLTHSAQLWYAPPRGVKTRLEGLETLRSDAQRPPPTQSEMADVPAAAVKTPKNKSGAKKSAKAAKPTPAAAEAPEVPNLEDFLADAPEGAVVNGLNAEKGPVDVAAPDMDAPEHEESAIRFCPTCRYYLYLQVEGEEQSLFRVCRNCGHREEDVKGGMVMEMKFRERASDGYKILLNEYTRQDPRLPHLKTIPCPDSSCDSNHGKAPSDVIYIKHDAVNMLYLYICNVCGFTWRSAR